MARHREFNEEEVLDRALEVFWRRGYAATSIDDLTAATGLGRGSLYGAFGDKEALFVTCLRRYTLRGQTAVLRALERPDPREAVARAFTEIAARFSDPRFPPGCLQTNTVLESAAVSEAVTRLNAAALAEFQAALYGTLCRAQALGQLRPGQDPLALAQFFATLAFGLAVSSRQSADPAVLRNAVQTALGVFEPAASADLTRENTFSQSRK